MSPLMIEPRSCTVIVVEDDFLVRDLAVSELEEAGYHVIDFSTADEALVHLTDHADEAQVVFTDVQMPGRLNGLDLVDIVSRRWPSIQVLVTSGGTLVNPAKLPPCARFVAKPWRGADIVMRMDLMAGARDASPRPC